MEWISCKHKIPMMEFVKYWDYIMGEFSKNWDNMAVNNSPKLNFKQWYETIKTNPDRLHR